MAEQRSLREIIQLPEVERERQPRQAQGFNLPKKWIVGLSLLLVGVVAGFVILQSVLSAPVPQVTGQSSDIAELQLKQAGFNTKIVERRFSSEKEGVVLAQHPAAHKKARRSSEVGLIVSGGTEEITMPDLIGDNELYSTRVLTQKGLVPVIVEEPSNKPEGTVLSTLPVVGEKVYTGDSVTLRVSSQRQQISLRDFDLSGKSVALVPAYSKFAPEDPTYDIARRLSALLKAAGAEPTIARSGGSKKNVLTRGQKSTSDCVVWISTRDKGSNGIIVFAPDGVAFTKRSPQYSIASGVYNQLSQNTVNVRGERGDFGAYARPKQWARISIGSLENLTDKTLIGDAQFKDLIAQSIYMGIGLHFQK